MEDKIDLGDYLTLAPWEHQQKAFDFLRNEAYAGLFAEMGCGKSAVAIGVMNYRSPDVVLIVCPVAMLRTWEREIRRFSRLPWRIEILTGSVKERSEKIQKNDSRTVFITNYEAFTYPVFVKAAQAFPKMGRSMIILDESHRIKNHNSKTTKTLTTLGAKFGSRLIMTGTPAADKPLDVFAQMRFLHPSILGSHYTPFLQRYAVTRQAQTRSGGWYTEILDYRNQEELNSIIYDHSFRVTKEVLDLPENPPDTEVLLDLDPKSRRCYEQMLKESLVILQQDDEVAATNVLTRLLRLQEITSGYLRADEVGEDGNRLVKDLNTIKRDALTSLLQDAEPEPVVVFYRFSKDAQSIAEAAKKAGYADFYLNGKAKQIEEWQDYRKGPALLAVQIKAGGAGVNLVHSAKVVYFSLTYSLTDYDQSRARTYRPGQLRPVQYYHLIVRDSIDEVILRALRNKKTTTNYLIDELRESQYGTV